MTFLEHLEWQSKWIKEFNEGYGKEHNIMLHDPNPRVNEEGRRRFRDRFKQNSD